jgi:serine/threonine protein kinase
MSDPSLLAGRYRLLERRDRTGTSWRSRDELLHRDVTISEVRLPPPGPHRDWLLSQVRATAGLRHPGITTLHDVIFVPDRMWLVTESIEGRSLIQTVRADGPFTPERAAEIGLRVLDALATAHEQGVHLVATPDAVLLVPDGRIVLTGTASAAPAGELRDLGITLFAAVEGRIPGTGSHPGFRLADGTSLADPDADSTGSGPLAPLLEELLAAEPVRRPDATSVRLTLERIAPRPARRGPRRGPFVAAAAVTAVLLLGGTAFWLWPRPSEPVLPITPVALPTFFPNFLKTFDPCKLISKQQAAKLWLEATPSREKATQCAWGTSDGTLPGNLRYSLNIEVFPYTSVKGARNDYADFLKQDRERTKTDKGLPLTKIKPVTALPGVAAEAFTLEDTDQLAYSTRVVFRAANLLVAIHYQRVAAEDSNHSTRKGALTAAQWVVKTLSRTK